MAEMSKYRAEQILGLQDEYNMKTLNKIYRKLALEFHPDAASAKGRSKSESEEHMAEINAARTYLEGIFRATGRITLTCDASATAYETASSSDEFAEAVRAAQEFAKKREQAARAHQQAERYEAARTAAREKVAQEEAARRARAYEEQDATDNDWGYRWPQSNDNYGGYRKATPKRSVGRKIASALRKLFSFDILFRILFVFLCVSQMGRTASDSQYIFWGILLLVALANGIFPFVTTPIRKIVLAVLDLVSPEARR